MDARGHQNVPKSISYILRNSKTYDRQNIYYLLYTDEERQRLVCARCLRLGRNVASWCLNCHIDICYECWRDYRTCIDCKHEQDQV